MNFLEINKDALSHGQIQSKLWLCEELEKNYSGPREPFVWVLGGWYGLLPFLIFSRDRLKPRRICSFDIDITANTIAEKVNEAWTIPFVNFYTFNADVTKLDYKNQTYGPPADIIINTSCEHFSDEWLMHVPKGTFVVAQSTNMIHTEHINKVDSLEEFSERLSPKLQLQESIQKDFNYSNFKFSRYMLMGQKI